MTREEADFIGALNMCDEISNEAYKKIMCHCEEQEPCEDCISRQSAIFLASDLKQDLPDDERIADMVMAHNEGILEYQTQLSLLPPVTPQPSEDAISRQAVDILVDELARAISDERCCISRGRSTATIMQDILKLPSVTPQPKIGRWIEKDGFDGDTYYDCSECGESWTTVDGTPWNNGMKYCPNCGARMEERSSEE